MSEKTTFADILPSPKILDAFQRSEEARRRYFIQKLLDYSREPSFFSHFPGPEERYKVHEHDVWVAEFLNIEPPAPPKPPELVRFVLTAD
jgi:hypothetical protein